jgi:hypothetical protein
MTKIAMGLIVLRTNYFLPHQTNTGSVEILCCCE